MSGLAIRHGPVCCAKPGCSLEWPRDPILEVVCENFDKNATIAVARFLSTADAARLAGGLIFKSLEKSAKSSAAVPATTTSPNAAAGGAPTATASAPMPMI